MKPTQRRVRRGLRVEAEDLSYVALGQKTGKKDCDQVGEGFECHTEEYKLLPAEMRDPYPLSGKLSRIGMKQRF